MCALRTPTGSRSSTTPTTAREDYGQGWTQLTDSGKVYLSKKEKNVFILEGTKAAGFSGCAYSGSEEQRDLVERGTFNLTIELKSVPGDQCADQDIFIVLDCYGMTDLSSGCDFCGIHLRFDARELRVESYRKNSTTQTLFALPNSALLRPQTYVTISVDVMDGAIAISLNGIVLIDNLPFGRPKNPNSGVGQLGIAVYGKTRCYLRRLRINPCSPETLKAAAAEKNAIVPAGSAVQGTRVGLTRRGTGVANVMDAASMTPLGAPTVGTTNFASDDMELAAIIERDIVVADLNVKFEDIGGLHEAKRAINEAVVLPLLIPEFFKGIRQPWKGVLLFGPPGTGKTMLAKAVASCTEQVTFFNCSSATLTSKWRGESEKLLRALFTTARARVPSILFFDEIDSLLSQRGATAEHEASRRFKSEFLIHMDGLLSDAQPVAEQAGHLLVLATSNAPWDLDEALRRRLEKRIFIPLPDEEARLRMFQHHLKDIKLGDEVDLVALAVRTEDYSGADVQVICRDASMNPMRRAVDGLSPMELLKLRDEGKLSSDSLQVEMSDFDSAIANTQPSVSPADLQRFLDWGLEFSSR